MCNKVCSVNVQVRKVGAVGLVHVDVTLIERWARKGRNWGEQVSRGRVVSPVTVQMMVER